MPNKVFYFIVILSFCTCSPSYYNGSPNAEFLIIQKDGSIRNGLRFDGFYHKIDSSNYHHPADYKKGLPTRIVDTPFADKPLVFFNNGYIAFSNVLFLDSLTFKNNMQKYGTQETSFINEWGVYNISNDTIKAILYITIDVGINFRHGKTQRVPYYFYGILKNSDAIFNWHLIPPFPHPKIILRNNSLFDYLSSFKNLYFKKTSLVTTIDPTKAWINKFK